jgi:aryl carrier-like protein
MRMASGKLQLEEAQRFARLTTPPLTPEEKNAIQRRRGDRKLVSESDKHEALASSELSSILARRRLIVDRAVEQSDKDDCESETSTQDNSSGGESDGLLEDTQSLEDFPTEDTPIKSIPESTASDDDFDDSFLVEKFSAEESHMLDVADIEQENRWLRERVAALEQALSAQTTQEISKQNDILKRQMDSIRRLNVSFAENLRELQAMRVSYDALSRDCEVLRSDNKCLLEQQMTLTEEINTLRQENNRLRQEDDTVNESHSSIQSQNSELYVSLNSDYKLSFQEHQRLESKVAIEPKRQISVDIGATYDLLAKQIF